MKRFMFVTIALCSLAGTLHAQRGGGFSAGGGARPNMQMGQAGGQFNRPNVGMQQMQQLQMQRPQVSMGGMQSINRPMPNTQQRPTIMPSMPSQVNRPTTLPSVNRPTGGMTPGIINRPINPGTPSTLPNRPSVQAPVTTLPGVTRPTNPSNPWRDPNLTPGGITRPGTGTGGGITRPGTGGPVTLPGTLPGTINRPGTGGNTRPGSGVDVGLDRPIRPTTPTIPPITGNRPTTLPVNRPGTGQRPDVRPPTTRPIINQPINVGNQQNKIINTRPSWVNINNTQITQINRQWNNAIVNRPQMHNWVNNNPARYRYWNGWGNGIRNNWRYYNYHNNWFGQTWWNTYHPAFGGWHYRYWLPYYPYNYWWSVPTWARLSTWFTWNAALGGVWAQPIYYDYGLGGNVIYQNNMVYVGGQPVSSSAEFAESAAALATVPPPPTEEQAAQAEWMPLGTFAMSTGEKDTDPTRVVQLAVTKEGIIGGTLFNYQTNQSVSIQGQVDKETQRVAFRLGDRDNLVAETGMYNLTQDEVPVLVHFGTEKTENFLFVRLKDEGEQPK